jgi:C4-dicarboxylate-specific signal transduction histidine kinase
MEYLLKSLKTFSLYDHIEFFDIPLKKFMDRFLSLIKGDFNARGIPILVESRLDIARIRIDKQALHQVLLNIFNNAADALKDQLDPQIKIKANVKAQLVCMTISDNGCGISLNQQKHLFQPFNTSKPKGNGLGLVITKKLLAMMNSDIKITSEQHLGTHVTISLPISPEQKEQAKLRQEKR